MPAALGFTVNSGSGNAGKSVASSVSFSLDDSTSLSEKTVLNEDSLFQTREVQGSGNNIIDSSISGTDFSAKSSIDSKGSLQASTSTGATSSSISLDQKLTGDGDIAATIEGTAGSDTFGQETAVVSGEISAAYTLVANGGIFTGQNTAMNGQAGAISARSSTDDNEMSLSGGFSGEGDISASINALADGHSALGGDAKIVGVDVLDDEYIGEVASGELGMSLDGLYAQNNGELGVFGMSLKSAKKGGSGSSTSALLTGPELTTDGGRSSAYVLTGYRWNTKDPQIKLYLKSDSNLAGEGLSTTSASSAIAAAANTWDDATNQNLFADGSSLVTVSTTVATDKRDYKNTLAWKYLSTAPSALAYARTWYSSAKVDGYYTAVESDISFNTRYNWKTDGVTNYDVQSVALHELGHTIGLGDLYGLSQFSTDTRQVMHYYTGVKRTLGNGDKTGVWTLYK